MQLLLRETVTHGGTGNGGRGTVFPASQLSFYGSVYGAALRWRLIGLVRWQRTDAQGHTKREGFTYSTRQKYSAPSTRRRRRVRVKNVDLKFCEHHN